MFSELIIEPALINGDPIGMPIHVTDKKEFLRTLRDFLDNHKGTSWIKLKKEDGSSITFLRVLGGPINNEKCKSVDFYNDTNGTLSFSIKE